MNKHTPIWLSNFKAPKEDAGKTNWKSSGVR